MVEGDGLGGGVEHGASPPEGDLVVVEVDEAGALGDVGEVDAVSKAQALAEGDAMELDGLDGAVQGFGHVGGAFSQADHSEDFELAEFEAREFAGGVGSAFADGGVVEEFEVVIARGDRLPDGEDLELVRVGGLGGDEGAMGDEDEFTSAEAEEFDALGAVEDVAEGFEAFGGHVAGVELIEGGADLELGIGSVLVVRPGGIECEDASGGVHEADRGAGVGGDGLDRRWERGHGVRGGDGGRQARRGTGRGVVGRFRILHHHVQRIFHGVETVANHGKREGGKESLRFKASEKCS